MEIECSKCKSKLPESSKYCNHCGAKISNQACPNCHRCGLPQDAQFCPDCGEQLCHPDQNNKEPVFQESKQIQNNHRRWFVAGITGMLVTGILIILFLILLYNKYDSNESISRQSPATEPTTPTAAVDSTVSVP